MSSYSNESFFCSKHISKLTAKKYLIVCALPETEDYVNLFQVDVLSLYRLKTPENFWFLDRFR